MCSAKNLKLSSGGEDSCSEKCNRAMLVSVVGCDNVFGYADSAARLLVLCWCVLQNFGFSHHGVFHI